jgi:hypothetical protein
MDEVFRFTYPCFRLLSGVGARLLSIDFIALEIARIQASQGLMRR